MIDVSPAHGDQIRAILHRHVPGCEVRAFGSRVTGRARPYSDLDLVVVGPARLPFRQLAALRIAFEESDLPYRVDVLDWHALTPEFQRAIEPTCQVFQPATSHEPY